MARSGLPGLRSVLGVLATLDGNGREISVIEPCLRAKLSRSSVDRAVRALENAGFVEKGKRNFGAPRVLTLTGRGRDAAASAEFGLLRYKP